MPAKKIELTVPRYENYRPRSVEASRVGAGNRRQDTTPEIVLRKTLWSVGIRYRLHSNALPGRPDLTLAKWRVVVFCDGDFWHGRQWSRRKKKLSKGWNAGYWVPKIERNRRRDRQVTRLLRSRGWIVIRVWESDVRRDPVTAVSKILNALRKNPEQRKDRRTGSQRK
jgi:DNA mismatch endonuclease (patch repair protein)